MIEFSGVAKENKKELQRLERALRNKRHRGKVINECAFISRANNFLVLFVFNVKEREHMQSKGLDGHEIVTYNIVAGKISKMKKDVYKRFLNLMLNAARCANNISPKTNKGGEFALTYQDL
ncbi:MAG: hypothetical protein GY679_01500 [Mycoplasma sp.]|nr:hypothetical protein [Mycoplasma sp.]